MKRWSRVSVAAVFCGLSAGAVCQQAQSAPQNLAVTIDASQTAEPVSRYEYGMFIEHIRTLIYRSLWSEMLDDRKFASGITSKPSETAGPASGPFRGMQPRLWRPVGGDGVVTMDKEQPFVGEQSPRIQLDDRKFASGITSKPSVGTCKGTSRALARRSIQSLHVRPQSRLGLANSD